MITIRNIFYVNTRQNLIVYYKLPIFFIPGLLAVVFSKNIK